MTSSSKNKLKSLVPHATINQNRDQNNLMHSTDETKMAKASHSFTVENKRIEKQHADFKEQ